MHMHTALALCFTVKMCPRNIDVVQSVLLRAHIPFLLLEMPDRSAVTLRDVAVFLFQDNFCSPLPTSLKIPLNVFLM